MEGGVLKSVFWEAAECDDINKVAVKRLQSWFAFPATKLLHRFYSSVSMAGVYEQGGFAHISAELPRMTVFQPAGDTVMARKKEDVKNMRFAVRQIKKETAETALHLLASGALRRAEVAKANAQFLVDAYRAKDNDFVHLVGEAPEGFCHPRSSVISTLLDNIESGMGGEALTNAWNNLMDPLVYKRPTEAPKAGNIARAEKLFEELGLADSLKRRFAAPSELQYLWKPPQKQTEKQNGVFGHLRKVTKSELAVDGGSITFVKFLSKVLPTAEVVVISPAALSAFTVAAVPESPPILAWDKPEARNTVATWTYARTGIQPHKFGLQGSQFVVGLTLDTWMKDVEDTGNRGQRAFWVLEATQAPEFYTGLFPENLRPELREVASVIEAHNQTDRTGCGKPDSYAAGATVVGASVVVNSNGVCTKYLIDRWD